MSVKEKSDFAQNISNEEVVKLPSAQFEGVIVVINDPAQVEAACSDLARHKIIGFDTETRPNFKPGNMNKVALLQLSTPTHCYLFRLHKVGLEKPLVKILETRKILKIGADVRDDIRALKGVANFRQGGFVDLQTIISKWGIAEKSVRKMSAIVLGSRVSKAQRLSNWEALNLTPAQQTYAATDAWICVEIYNKLQKNKKNPLKPTLPITEEPKSTIKNKRRKLFSSKKRTKESNANKE